MFSPRLISAALSLAALSAQAAVTLDLGTLGVQTSVLDFQYVKAQGGASAQGAADTFTFDLSTDGDLILDVYSTKKPAGSFSLFDAQKTLLATANLVNATSLGKVTLNAGSGTAYDHYQFSFLQLDASNDYVLRFTPSGNATVNYKLGFGYNPVVTQGQGGVTPPVPEPEGYALLAAGLAVLGLAQRRRAR